MKILLTGGSGFIGGHLARALFEAGHELFNFDRTEATAFPGTDVRGDVRDALALKQAVAGMDLVIHLAAEHSDDVVPESRYAETNVTGARHLVEALEGTAVNRVLLFSSASVYGHGSTIESGPNIEPRTPYGQSKLSAERLLRDWFNRSQTDRALRILRPCVVYGPGHHGNMRRLIDAVDRKRLVLVGSGRNTKSVCYVGNLVAATLFDLAVQPGLRIHNVADLPNLDMYALTRLIRTSLHHDPNAIWRVPKLVALGIGSACDLLARTGGFRFELSAARVQKFCANTSLSTEALFEAGFRAPYDHAEGLRATLAASGRTR